MIRVRKARGKRPAAVTLTEDEIVHICIEHVRELGYEVDNSIILKVPFAPTEGKKRKQKLEISVNIKSGEDAEFSSIPKKKAEPRSIFSPWKPTKA